MLRSAMTLTMLLGALNLAAGSAHASEVYKYTDEKGNTFYTDKPATLPAERMNVNTKKSTPAATTPAPSAPATNAAAAPAAAPKANDPPPLTAKDRADRCAKARDRVDMYITSRRLYEEKAGGERRYLTDKELDAARAEAKANMDVWCK